MSACTPCALRFYISSTARGRYTHSRLRGTRHSHEGKREESALAQVLFNTPTETRPPGEKSSPVASRSQEEHNEGSLGPRLPQARLRELGLKRPLSGARLARAAKL